MTTRNIIAYRNLRLMGCSPTIAWRFAHKAAIVRVLGQI